MGLRGPARKDPEQLSHRSKTAADKAHLKVVTSEPASAPPLPAYMPGGYDWPTETREWWQSWTQDPLTNDYRNSDWLDLLDCAVIHGRLWGEDPKMSQAAAAELRLRMARHGATRADRASLRITFATAEMAERRANSEPKTPGKSAYDRRGGLHSVPKPDETG